MFIFSTSKDSTRQGVLDPLEPGNIELWILIMVVAYYGMVLLLLVIVGYGKCGWHVGVDTLWILPNLVEIGRSVLTSLNYLVKSVFSSAAMLDFEKINFWVSAFLDSVKMNHPAKLDANRTYRFQVIQLLVKNNVFVGGRLGFQKWPILSIRMSGLCQAESPCRIWCISDIPLWCNSIFL